MRNPMMPDYMFRTFDEITPAFLASLGVKAILADIDNTLAPYEQPEPDERIKGWIASLAEAGIGIACLTSLHTFARCGALITHLCSTTKGIGHTIACRLFGYLTFAFGFLLGQAFFFCQSFGLQLFRRFLIDWFFLLLFDSNGLFYLLC